MPEMHLRQTRFTHSLCGPFTKNKERQNATKAYLKNATGVDTSGFAKKTDLADIKYDVDKLNFDKLKNVPVKLNSLKSKVDKLGADKLVPALVFVDLSKLSDAVERGTVKNYIYIARIKNIEDIILAKTNLATNFSLNAKINQTKNKIPSITNLATTAALTTVENKIPYVSNLVN